MPRFKDVFKLFVFAVLILLGTLTLFSCDINKSDSNDITVGIKISDDTVFRFGKDVNVIIPSTKDDVKITKIDVRDGVDFNDGDYPAKTIIIPKTIKVITQRSFSFLSNLEAFYVDPNSQYFKSIDGVLYDKSGTLLLCYPRGKTEETFAIPEGVKVILEGAFKGNTHLKEVIIPNTVTEIGPYAFAGLSYIREIIIPDSVIKIQDKAFSNCVSLEVVEIGSNVRTIENHAFEDCKSIESIVLPDSVKNIGIDVFTRCTSLKEITLPDGITAIRVGMFKGCSALTSFVVPDTVKYIEMQAFNGSGIENIALPEGLLSIGDSFQNCDSLTSITIPSSLVEMGSAFRNCNNLETITFLGGGIYFSTNCFVDCKKLTEIHAQSEADWAAMKFSHAEANPFLYGAKLYIDGKFVTSFDFPADTTYINSCIFAQYKYLESVTIPEGVTDIEYGAFLGCNKITEISIPSTVENMGYDVFGSCTSLKTVYLPSLEWWLNLKTYGSGLFTNAETVYVNGEITTSVVIPDGTEMINSYTFYECEFLTDIHIPVSVRYLSTNSFARCGKLNIHYGASTKEFQYLDNNSHYWYESGDDYTVYCTNGVIIP